MKRTEKIIGLLMLVGAILFNLWIYRLEPTAQTDPNDNTFQYALVDRTNQIWDYANKSCPKNLSFVICHLSFLSDHWVPNWAEGYNLPYYYSHIPQIVIVTSYRFINSFIRLFGYSFIGLFTYYHWVTYLLLSFFPLSLYLALFVIGVSPITAGFGALISTQLSTDGLYGLDPSSFLWRGYGLTSQLYAMVFFPLAIAFAYRGKVKPAILFLAATTAGHLGIGIMAFMSIAIIGFRDIKKLLFIYGGVFLLLGYWILPILKDGNFHNTSVWDPIWKFDSYGYREVLKNLFNGDLFDFGRLPILTGLVFVGLFISLLDIGYWVLGIVFIFMLLMYFGTTTWGTILYLIPGMSDFHISRFIVGVHMAGLFLIPLGFEWIVSKISKREIIRLPARHRYAQALAGGFVYFIIGLFVYLIITPQTLQYSAYNDILIKRANTNYSTVKSDVDSLLLHLKSYLLANPGRVFAGRGGTWGKTFRVAETPYYIYLSTYGIPTVLWLPETWSPNSDTEQYFSEDKPDDYSLYNIRYVVTPANIPNGEPVEPQPFWKLLTASKTWKLYSVIPDSTRFAESRRVGDPVYNTLDSQRLPAGRQVRGNDTSFGYITTGVRPAIVSVDKLNFTNVVRLWIQSDFPKTGLYPELTFDKQYPVNVGLPNFRMIDEALYKVPDGSIHDLFHEVPSYLSPNSPSSPITLISQSDDHDMVFKATVEVPPGCTECIVILKQSFHPSWKATVDGKDAETFTVFPFFIAVKMSAPGTHTITFSYRPSWIKIVLLLISLITLISLICLSARMKFKARR